MFIPRWPPRDGPNTVKAQQAEFRAQPEITVWAKEVTLPLENPSRKFHAVCAY